MNIQPLLAHKRRKCKTHRILFLLRTLESSGLEEEDPLAYLHHRTNLLTQLQGVNDEFQPLTNATRQRETEQLDQPH